jgi:glycosyltransferase involved in cell wall biosynthesis
MHKQLHIVAHAGLNSGGEGLAATLYAESLARSGCDVTLISNSISGSQVSKTLGYGFFTLKLIPIQSNLIFRLYSQYKEMNRIYKKNQIDLIHIHGMWSSCVTISAFFAYIKSIPFVISPHGCIEPWALNHKYFKKWLALKIYQKRILHLALALVATSTKESESIRRLNLKQPVALIPNGVEVSHLKKKKKSKIKTLLFLSRIHPIKGLHDLVFAWDVVKRPDWRILIAGAGESDYVSKIKSLIREKGLDFYFEFVGFVEGRRKQECFDAADIFILPTYSENFGIAIAEALANELPVITTTGAPWRDLLDFHCGWWVEPGVQGITDALKDAISCDLDELSIMGKRGRQLVIHKYSWERIGYSALALSTWLLDQSKPKPKVMQELENNFKC